MKRPIRKMLRNGHARSCSSKSDREGAVVIELAVCLPVIVLIVLASIESASLTFAKQTMVQTAYEAVVVAVRRESTNIDATNAARAVTNGRLIGDVSIRFEPPDVSAVPRGELITVTAEIPGSAARRLGSNLLGVSSISASATMVKE
jgi:hypothetical protein